MKLLYLITYEKLSEKVGTVTTIAYNPIPEMFPAENYFQVDQAIIPDREDIPNMDTYLRVDLETKDMYYDYIARETFETKVASLQAENSALKLENESLKSRVSDVEMTLTEILFSSEEMNTHA